MNATWCNLAYGAPGEETYTKCISPDSLIDLNGIIYSRIYYQKSHYESLSTIYYREEDRKFYILPEDSINEILLYDFNLNLGDTFRISEWGWNQSESATLTVHQVDSYTTLDGIERKQIYLSDQGAQYNVRWLEGIGTPDWIFVYPNYRGILSGGFPLTCFSVEGEIIEGDVGGCQSLIKVDNIKPKKTVILFPNPTYGKLSVSGITNYKSMKIYNSWGQEFSYKMNGQDIDITNFKAGVYLAIVTDQHNNQYFGKIAKL
ncbi:MAG TPA: T9SS type A sorting domain-containing protein [Saprospiraceae bacterium]|nr:T9SS type A sorting domain-containing protein [Saprospiraceae bacterium]